MEIRQTKTFIRWITRLRDRNAFRKINIQIERMALGNFGDIKAVGGNVSEIRINYGPGYRIYITSKGVVVVVLLCGGDKSTQPRDIETARRLAADLED